MSKNSKILVCDDDETLSYLLKEQLLEEARPPEWLLPFALSSKIQFRPNDFLTAFKIMPKI